MSFRVSANTAQENIDRLEIHSSPRRFGMTTSQKSEPVLMHGWLNKRTETRKILQTWHRRYWTLTTGGTLKEFVGINAYRRGDQPKRTIVLLPSSVRTVQRVPCTQFTFRDGGRRYLLGPGTEKSFARWRNAFDSIESTLPISASNVHVFTGLKETDKPENKFQRVAQESTSSVMKAIDDTGEIFALLFGSKDDKEANACVEIDRNMQLIIPKPPARCHGKQVNLRS